MIHLKRIAIATVTSIAILGTFSSRASAAPGYNCKPDKRLDVPMQFSADIQSAGRVHLTASGGADKSGYVAPWINGAWRLYDSKGTQLTSFTSSLVLFASVEMLKETYVEGLLPGSYTIDLTSMDLCGNLGHARRTIVISTPTFEGNAPVISTPTLAQVGALGASGFSLYFTGTDDTGLKRVAVYVNGDLISEYNYFNGTSFRWWTAFYPDDSSLTQLEGPSFYVGIPEIYKYRSSLVEVVAEDVFGNQFTASATMVLQ